MPSSSSDEEAKNEEHGISKKRKIETDEASEDSDDGWIGPSLSEAAPIKKKKILPFESVYLENLPNAETYERSYMHRDMVTWCLSSGPTGFVVTGSIDGHVKFWKKRDVGIEFVKHFRAHIGTIRHMTINSTGTLMYVYIFSFSFKQITNTIIYFRISVSNDKHGKVFDVVNFDMINILALDFVPEYAAWVHQAGAAIPAVAIAGNVDSPAIRIYDGRGASTPLKVLNKMHMKPISCMVYNPVFDVAISADIGGMIEYWRGPKGTL